MRLFTRSARIAGLCVLLTLSVGGGMLLQAQRGRVPYPPSPGRADEPDPNDPRRKLTKRMLRDSFQAMQKESEELVVLSNELREIVRNSTEDEMSLGAMKKAEQIEKLAERIKNRIKNL